MMRRIIYLLVAVLTPTVAFSAAIHSKNVTHTQAYKLHPERGQYVDIKVTPPGARGADGRVLVEVYNRGKSHLALIQFDVTLTNHGGFGITAAVKAEDLSPNMSGSQWVKIPMIKGAFPVIDEAIVDNVHVVTVDARDIKINTYVDLIKN